MTKNLEAWLGTRAIAWVGAVFIIIGLSSYVAYNWEIIGPLLKLGTGFALSACFVVLGEYLSERKDKLFYGQVLSGIGYAFAYWLIYAMQNIAAVKVMDNQLINSCLQLVLATVCMGQSVVRSRQSMALLAMLMAFLSISLSQVSYFSVIATGLITLGLVAIVIKMNWQGLLAGAIAGSYTTFFLVTSKQIALYADNSISAFGISAAFLSMFWMLFNACAFMLKAKTEEAAVSQRISIPVMALVNGLAYVSLMFLSMQVIYAGERWLFLLGTGVFYLVIAALAHRQEKLELSHVFSLFGLALATASAPLKLDAQTLSLVWFAEVPALMIAGLYLNLPSLRIFALLLAIASGLKMTELLDNTLIALSASWQISQRLFIASIAFVSYGISTLALNIPNWKAKLSKEENLLLSASFQIMCLLLLWLTPMHEASNTQMLSNIWLIEAVFLFLLVPFMNTSAWGASFLAISTALLFIIEDLHTQTMRSLPVNKELMQFKFLLQIEVALAAGLFLTGAAYKFLCKKLSPIHKRTLSHTNWFAGIILMLVCTNIHMPSQFVVASLAAQSLALLALGYLMKDAPLRQSSLIVMTICFVNHFWHISNWSWLSVASLSAAMYLITIFYARLKELPNSAVGQGNIFEHLSLSPEAEAGLNMIAYSFLGTIVLLAGCGHLLSVDHVTFAWLAIMISLTTLGFVLKVPTLRWMAFLVALGVLFNLLKADFQSLAIINILGFKLSHWLLASGTAALSFLASSLVYSSIITKNFVSDTSKEENEASALVFGIAFLFTALILPYKELSGGNLTMAWTAEALLLYMASLRSKNLIYAWLGMAFAICGTVYGSFNAQTLHWTALALTCGSLSGSAYLFSKTERLSKDQTRLLTQTNSAMCMILIAAWTQAIAPKEYLASCLALEGALLIATGFVFRDSWMRQFGSILMLITTGLIVSAYSTWTWWTVSPVIFTLYLVAASYQIIKVQPTQGQTGYLDSLLFNEDAESNLARLFYTTSATLLLTVALAKLLSSQMLAIAWSLEGLALITFGFILKDKLLRLSGLGIFTLMTGKLLFFDLSGAQTQDRILSFVVAGVVLLAASYAYTFFERKLIPGKTSKQ